MLLLPAPGISILWNLVIHWQKLDYAQQLRIMKGRTLVEPASPRHPSYCVLGLWVRSGAHNHNKMLIKSTGSHLLHWDEYIIWVVVWMHVWIGLVKCVGGCSFGVNVRRNESPLPSEDGFIFCVDKASNMSVSRQHVTRSGEVQCWQCLTPILAPLARPSQGLLSCSPPPVPPAGCSGPGLEPPSHDWL